VSFIGACVSFAGENGKETARLGETKAFPASLMTLRWSNEL